MTRIKMPAHQSRGLESERGGSVNRRWAAATSISVLLALSFVETACAPGVERQIVIPIQGAQDFGLSKSELAQYNQTKEDFKSASKDKVFDMTTNNLSSTQSIISSDLTRATGVNITPEQVNIDFDQVDPFWINVGADRLSFAPVPVNIQVEGEETSRTLLFMFGKAEGGQWGQVGFFSPDQKPNESGEINANLVLDLTENATPEIGGLVISSDGNERFSRQILFTKDKDGKLVLVESFPDPNKPSQAMVLNQNDLFSLADTPNQPQANFTNVSFKMAAPAIATVTPTPPGGGEGGTDLGEAPAAVTVKSYETRDASGKLVSTEDIYGNVINASYEIVVPPATAEDWSNVNARLGAEFAVNPDGTITGVEGLNIDMANGKAVFNFDGKGIENYHIQNIKVQEINGEKRLLVAGYMWNGETASWEVFNPGFPMESPEAQLGWFTQADVPNGNWLRWHQRALEDLAKQNGFKNAEEYLKELFKNAMVPDGWYAQETLIDDRDMNEDGTKDVIHNRKLVWTSGTYNSSLPADQKEIIKKDQFPWRGGLSFSFLADSDCVLVSFDVQNGDKSKTSMPTALDSVLWTDFRDKGIFTRAALANGHEWDSSMAETGPFNDTEGWVFGLVINSLPDATITNSMGESDLAITKEPVAAQRREETIVGSIIAPEAGLEIWGSAVLGNYHE